MPSSDHVPAGTWVQLELCLLAPGERAPGLPAETAAQPLLARVKGFLLAPARMGGEARIRTAAGREVAGSLCAVNPAYEHGFGEIVPEIMAAGSEARAFLAAHGRRG